MCYGLHVGLMHSPFSFHGHQNCMRGSFCACSVELSTKLNGEVLVGEKAFCVNPNSCKELLVGSLTEYTLCANIAKTASVCFNGVVSCLSPVEMHGNFLTDTDCWLLPICSFRGGSCFLQTRKRIMAKNNHNLQYRHKWLKHFFGSWKSQSSLGLLPFKQFLYCALDY